MKEPALDVVGAKINRDLCWGAQPGTGSAQEALVQKLWSAMEEVICPGECGIYSYQPDTDCDPLSSEGKVLSLCMRQGGELVMSLSADLGI